MKRRAFERWFTEQGCELLREGARHSWFIDRELQRRFSVPRHNEIGNELVRKICRDLGIASPEHT